MAEIIKEHLTHRKIFQKGKEQLVNQGTTFLSSNWNEITPNVADYGQGFSYFDDPKPWKLGNSST